MNTRSIYVRLISWYSGLVILVLAAFAAYTYQGVQQRLHENVTQSFTRRAHQIAENVLVPEKSPQEIAKQVTYVYSPEANNRFIRILKSDRSVLYVSGNPKDGHFSVADIPVPSGNIPVHRVQLLPHNAALFIVATSVMAAGSSYTIEIGLAADELNAILRGLLITLVFGLPVVLLIVSAGGYALVRRSLRPVEKIRATAEKITFGNLSNRLPVVETGDELENLSVTLNQMLERLDDAYQQASRFSADASHELRTPLSIMRAELESIIQREARLPHDLRERIASVLEETERLSHIAESLFTISRLDAGEDRTEPVMFYLVDLVNTTKDQMLLMAEEKGIKITVEASSGVKVKGNAARLKQVVVNILDNAIKYTPAGGNISIRIYSVPHKAVLEMTDTGIGIPAEALPHVFERFYRADKVRWREQGGAGLGLSIVRSICQAQGGSIEITSAENKGTTCRVELPLAV